MLLAQALGDCGPGCQLVSCDGSTNGPLCCYCPKQSGFLSRFFTRSSRVAGADSSMSGGTIAALLGALVVVGTIGYIGMKEHRDTPAIRRARAIMKR